MYYYFFSINVKFINKIKCITKGRIVITMRKLKKPFCLLVTSTKVRSKSKSNIFIHSSFNPSQQLFHIQNNNNLIDFQIQRLRFVTITMDAFSTFFDSQSSSRNGWTYDSLKNFRQISPIVQTHLKQVPYLSLSLSLCCLITVIFGD